MAGNHLLRTLLSHLDQVLIEDVSIAGGATVIRAKTTTALAECPGCGVVSSRIHGRYRRRLADVTLAQRPVMIYLQVRRFLCITAGCARPTFVEQVTGLTQRFARRSQPLRKILQAIGLGAGRTSWGPRLTYILSIPAGANTLLRLVRARRDTPTERGADPHSRQRSDPS